jgi:hypothetical protein
MNPFYCSVDLFYGFSFRKIILKVMKIPRPLYFYKKPVVYFIYILVPAILKKQP